ncbi:hypothetical protein [Alteromonas facilis]|uniref:hypothetical protein n=1 Tax=Alteromonas facilis TaxID=2048004 RepID=UPI000C291133|nr:hypothetical protein [Alteromonas facilis]
MTFGLSCIDQAVDKFGIAQSPTENEFQTVQACFGGEVPASIGKPAGKDFPFCIKRFLFQAPIYSQWMVHTLTLPKSGKLLACFIMDLNGQIVERVYYQNSRKYYNACDKLLNLISTSANAKQVAA